MTRRRAEQLIVTGRLIAPLLVLLCLLPAAAAARPGNLDTTFNSTGTALTQVVPANSHALGALVQPDGKTVAVGDVQRDSPPLLDFALARYNTDGTLDSGFGSGGTVVSHIGAASQARAVARQSDGKLIVAGGAVPSGSTVGQVAIARYLTNGTLDTGFGTNGVVMGTAGGAADVVVQPDDKIVVALGQGPDQPCGPPLAPPCGPGKFAIARYLPDGTVDTGFGTNGVASAPITGTVSTPTPRSVVRQASGRLTVSGFAFKGAPDGSPGTTRVASAAFTSTGAVDTSFGSNGLAFGPDPSSVGAAALQSDKLLTGFNVSRYTVGGSLDASFGSGGTAAGSATIGPSSLAVQSDDKIVFGGLGQVGAGAPPSPLQFGFGVGRLTAGGAVDLGFGTCGTTTNAMGDGNSATLSAVALAPNGGMVAAGSATQAGVTKFAVARYVGGDAAPQSPTAITDQPTDVHSSSNPPSGTATLRATVNAHGVQTTVHFEYQRTDDTSGNWTSTGNQAIGAGESDQSVSTTVPANGDLQPGVSYRDRVVARTPCTSATGNPQTFSVPPAAPDIYYVAANGVATDHATLDGAIIPDGASTSYHFEYGLSTTYGRSAPVPDGSLPADNNPHDPSEVIRGLSPGTTYHYRLVATNSAGSSASADQSFTTLVPSGPGPTTPAGGMPSGAAPLSSSPAQVQTVGPTIAGAATNVGGSVQAANKSGTFSSGILVSCDSPACTANGTGKARVPASVARVRTLRVAAGSVQLSAGKRLVVRLRLSKQGQRALKRLGKLKVRVTVTVDAAGRTPVSHARTLTLKLVK